MKHEMIKILIQVDPGMKYAEKKQISFICANMFSYMKATTICK